MNKSRLAAFSDGVFAILITITVLELHPPADASWAALHAVLPQFLTYVLSFIYLAIYWNNHHHFLHVVSRVNGRVLWANLHLLFWLSLIPFATGWLGEAHESAAPTVVYGVLLLMAAIAYTVLTYAFIAVEGPESRLRRAIGTDVKGWASLVLYAVGIAVAFFIPLLADALYLLVALLWLIPDRRMERVLQEDAPQPDAES